MRERFRIDVVVALTVMVALIVADAQIGRARRAAALETGRRVEQTEGELRYLAGHASEIGEVVRFLPRPAGNPSDADERFLSEVSDAARGQRLAITKVEPGGEEPYGTFVARHYKMNFEGGYAGFAGFLRFLETMPETVIVTNMDCSSKDLVTGPSHRMTLEVTVIGRSADVEPREAP